MRKCDKINSLMTTDYILNSPVSNQNSVSNLGNRLPSLNQHILEKLKLPPRTTVQ